MRIPGISISLAVALMVAAPAHAGREAIPRIVSQISWQDGHLLIEADQPLAPRLFSLHAPERVVIDLFGAELADPDLAQTLPLHQGPYTQLRVARHPSEGFLRLVLDCEAAAPVRVMAVADGTSLWVVPGDATVALASPSATPSPHGERGSAIAPEAVHLEALGPPIPPEWSKTEIAGPPLPSGWDLPVALGPPLPASWQPTEGPPLPVGWAGIALGGPVTAPPEPKDAPPPVWDGQPQKLRSIQWERRKGRWVLRLTGDHPLACDVRQEWGPPRLSVHVPCGSFSAPLPPPPDRGLSVEVAQDGRDWVLNVAMPRAVYGFEARREEGGAVLEVAWGRQALVDRRPTVILDPGHGGSDPGAIGPAGTREATVTLALARATRAELEAEGDLNVVLTRTADTTVDLASRTRLIDALHPALFVSLHANSCSTPEIGGFETYYRNEISLPLARFLHQSVVGALGRPDRGVRQARLFVLRHPSVPSVLLESAYLSNPAEEKLLNLESYQHDLGVALARGIRTYLAQQDLSRLPRGARDRSPQLRERIAGLQD